MSTNARGRILAAAAIGGLAVAGLAACTSDRIAPAPPYQLVFFDSCDDALAGLRAATKAMITSYGFAGSPQLDGLPVPLPAVAGEGALPPGFGQREEPPQQADAGQAPDHSGTNVQEVGVDEPDLVKTDGRRIVTVSNGRLSVVDVASRRLVGVVELRGPDGGTAGNAELLLTGDHALVVFTDYFYPSIIVPMPEGDLARGPYHQPSAGGTTLLLVDLATPRVLSRAHADGYAVDARQVGSTVRLVLRSAPRLALPNVTGTDDERLAAYRAYVDSAGIDVWAPGLEVTTGGHTVRTRVGCDSISHTANYSGANLLTVLSFDASQPGLGDGMPMSIVADGDTVYSTASSLYIASNQAWARVVPQFAGVVPAQPGTEIYRFDISGTKPRYVGGGSVPGQLINQYAMSEWDGRLRIATTSQVFGADGSATTQSGVFVLAAAADRLVPVGAVEGLGRGERIYAVRFVGPVAYVVTFRQTDPLYTVDLHDPSAPVVRGELKIPGYSAYLHPIDGSRLIGVGQDATEGGRTLGTQVSLFDVSDIANPTRLAKYTLAGAYSEAEVDPHAFLFWPSSGLLVVPLQAPPGMVGTIGPSPYVTSGALVLRVHDDQISELGFISQPPDRLQGWAPEIRRSLVTVSAAGHTTLWTVSDVGLQANDAATLAHLAWIPL